MLYYLVTGKVPFPGGGTLEKIIRHRMDEPRPLAKLRPGVPGRAAGHRRQADGQAAGNALPDPAELVQTLTVYLTQTGPAQGVTAFPPLAFGDGILYNASSPTTTPTRDHPMHTSGWIEMLPPADTAGNP